MFRLYALALFATVNLAWAEEPSPSAPESTAPPVVQRQAAPLRSEHAAAALAAAWPEHARTLDAGGEPFVALWHPANSDAAKGVVVLLPGLGETADWPRVIGPLRRRLPDYGWHTLSLSPPPPAADPVTAARPPIAPEPPSDNAPANTADPADEPSSEPPKTEPVEQATGAEAAKPAPVTAGAPAPVPSEAGQAAARLQAAIDFANEQGPSRIVIVGHGAGAHWAASFLSDPGNAEVAGLALIEPRRPTSAPALAPLVAALQLPVLDLYYRSDGADRAAKQRRDLKRRQAHAAYQQLPLQPGVLDEEHLIRRVRGWLDRSF